jgi:hypothetical protein
MQQDSSKHESLNSTRLFTPPKHSTNFPDILTGISVRNLGSLDVRSSGCLIKSRDLERHTARLGDMLDPKSAPASWKKGFAAGSGTSHCCNALGDQAPI